MPVHGLPRLDRTDTFGRTSHDQISRLQGKQGRQIGDSLADRPDQIGEVAALYGLAIDLQSNDASGDFTHRFYSADRTDRRRVVKGLADFPGTTLFTHGHLQIAARHVQAHGITEDMRCCILYRDVDATLADGDHQFDLVVVIGGTAGISNRTDRRSRYCDDGSIIVGLAKEKWRFAAGIKAHLPRMSGIIAADTINPAHRKLRGRIDHRQTDDGLRCEYKRTGHLGIQSTMKFKLAKILHAISPSLPARDGRRN